MRTPSLALPLLLVTTCLAGPACGGGSDDDSASAAASSETAFDSGFDDSSTGDGDSATGDGDGDGDSATGDGDTGPSPDLPDDPDPEGCAALEELVDALAAEPDPAADAVLVEAFVAAASYGEHGLPLVEDSRVCFVYLGTDVGEVSVAGDFNGWDPAAAPLSEAAANFGYAIVELGETPAGLYKLVRGQAEYVADPLARRFGWDEFGEYSQVDPIPARSHHERWPEFGAAPDQGAGLLAPRTLTVWVPPDADGLSELPVLYMHDGQNLFAPDALWGGWQVGATLDAALDAALIDPVIVVGVDNTSARMDEYTQVEDVLDGMVFGGRADEYASFLVDGILPFVEARYPVAPSGSGDLRVGVMGSSLGGLVSLYIGASQPGTFGFIGSMSGTIAWGSFGANNPTILDSYPQAPPVGATIYLDSGGDSGLGCPGDGSDNYCANLEFADMLRGLGWVDEDDLFYRWDPGAPHNEAAWAGRLLDALLLWSPL